MGPLQARRRLLTGAAQRPGCRPSTPSMSAMEDLFALQDEDVLTGQLKYRKARLPEADAVVAAESARVQISSEVADLRIERLDHARRQNRFEGEVAAVEARLTELDQRLYGSAITSPKEATTLQNEIASLRRRQNDLEGQVLEIMELVEPFDVRLEELAVASDAADEAIAAARRAGGVGDPSGGGRRIPPGRRARPVPAEPSVLRVQHRGALLGSGLQRLSLFHAVHGSRSGEGTGCGNACGLQRVRPARGLLTRTDIEC